MDIVTFVLISFAAAIGLLIMGLLGYAAIFCARNMGLWIEAKAAGLPVSLIDLLVIELQKLSKAELLEALKVLWKAGYHVDIKDLQNHVLSGGSLSRLVQATVSAGKAGLDVDFKTLSAIDLAGRNIADAVKTSVEPKVLECPMPTGTGRGIVGMTQDGIALSVKVRITVRTRIERLVGGSGEATVIARVGEGIVSCLGKTASHKTILEQPETIAEHILSRGLDGGTCFEILSIDIADVDVLENVNAKLEMSRAETDKRIAQARAEIARADALAQQQEMKAVNLNNEAKVVEAKTALPVALSSALSESRIGSPMPFPAMVPERLEFWKHGAKAFVRR